MSEFDLNKKYLPPNAFVQYKGTDICMDFHCKCGEQCHFDGFSAYTVKCQHCKQCYEMPPILFSRECKEDESTKTMEGDEDLDWDGEKVIEILV